MRDGERQGVEVVNEQEAQLLKIKYLLNWVPATSYSVILFSKPPNTTG